MDWRLPILHIIDYNQLKIIYLNKVSLTYEQKNLTVSSTNYKNKDKKFDLDAQFLISI